MFDELVLRLVVMSKSPEIDKTASLGLSLGWMSLWGNLYLASVLQEARSVCNMTSMYNKVTLDKLRANWVDRYHEGVSKI